jgi:rare lipoprotein A
MQRDTSPGAPATDAPKKGSSHRRLAIWALTLPSLGLVSVPLTAQTVSSDASTTYSQTCTAAKAVHDLRCPNYTGFKTRLGGSSAPEAAADQASASGMGDAAPQPEVSAPAPVRLSFKPGRDIGRGMASWYGPGFHGRKTANGERFDMGELTAAHKTLPFGTKVLVSNPRTGKQVVVRINDRGPYARGRVIDLSKAAAAQIGLQARGHDMVVLTEVGTDTVVAQNTSAAN